RLGRLRRRSDPGPPGHRALDWGTVGRPGVSPSELRRKIEVLVKFRVQSRDFLLREHSRRDARDHRDPVYEGHVVRLAEEADHIGQRGLRDDLVEAVVQDHAALPFAGDLEDGPQADRVEVFGVDRARGAVPPAPVCSSPNDWHHSETSAVVRSASTEIGLRQFEHWVRLAAHDRWYRKPHVHRYAGSLARISRWQCGHVPRTPPVCPAPVGIATFFTTMCVSSFSAAAARATWPE